MSNIWPRDKIRELLAQAEAFGFARAACGSAEEAGKFRFAIYYFRRQHSIGLDLAITLEDSSVIVRKVEMPEVSINQGGSSAPD